MSEEAVDYKAIDAVVNIWTEEALSARPNWGNDFFSGKMNADAGMIGQPDPAGKNARHARRGGHR
jgi:hypothetical protein